MDIVANPENVIEICKIALDAMKAAKSDYINTVYTTIASLIVAIGWVLTSAEARKFINEHKLVWKALLFGSAFMWLFHIVNLTGIADRAIYAATYVNNACSGLSDSVFAVYQVLWWWPWASIAFNSVLFSGFILMVYIIGSAKESRVNTSKAGEQCN